MCLPRHLLETSGERGRLLSSPVCPGTVSSREGCDVISHSCFVIPSTLSTSGPLVGDSGSEPSGPSEGVLRHGSCMDFLHFLDPVRVPVSTNVSRCRSSWFPLSPILPPSISVSGNTDPGYRIEIENRDSVTPLYPSKYASPPFQTRNKVFRGKLTRTFLTNLPY